MLGEVADAAGLPPGVLNIVTGDIAAGQALTSHPGVDVVKLHRLGHGWPPGLQPGRPQPEEGDPGTGR